MNAHQTIQAFSKRRGRPTKFTPERMRQITNLVERGKSRQGIAEIIGVTTGTLQVTCSKLGISLRQPRLTLAPVCCGAGDQVRKNIASLQRRQVRSRS
jgi:transposase-like protein